MDNATYLERKQRLAFFNARKSVGQLSQALLAYQEASGESRQAATSTVASSLQTMLKEVKPLSEGNIAQFFGELSDADREQFATDLNDVIKRLTMTAGHSLVDSLSTALGKPVSSILMKSTGFRRLAVQASGFTRSRQEITLNDELKRCHVVKDHLTRLASSLLPNGKPQPAASVNEQPVTPESVVIEVDSLTYGLSQLPFRIEPGNLLDREWCDRNDVAYVGDDLSNVLSFLDVVAQSHELHGSGELQRACAELRPIAEAVDLAILPAPALEPALA